MDTLALKLLVTPALIAVASPAGRRWGPAVSGWLVGLPLTSAPVAFFVALDRGRAFAATTALNTLAGTLAQVAFCLAYAWLARRCSWPLAVLAGSLAFAAATGALQHLTLPLAPLFLTVIAALVVAPRLLPLKVGVICPGGVKTECALGKGRTAESVAQSAMLEPEDVAAAVVLACTQALGSRIIEIQMRPMGEPLACCAVEEPLPPSMRRTGRFAEPARGRSWTIDAPYRAHLWSVLGWSGHG
jgi:hypothetical protein